MKYGCIICEVRDRIATITLTRLDKLNSLTQVFWKEIREALEAGDKKVRYACI